MEFNFRAVLAITVAVLMVTGMVAPAAAAGGETTTRTLDGDQSAEQTDDRSSLTHRLAAYQLLEEAGEGRELQHLNATLEHVVDANRMDARSIFHDDRLVVARTQANHTEAAEHLVFSDRALAETALADARQVREQLERRNHSYNETAVEDYLANASADLQDGHDHVDGDRLVAAVEAYQRAWTATNRALDVMQRGVDPQVTITRREDPPHDGNVTYSIEGTVWAVRSHQLNTSLTINGEELNVTLQSSTVPGANAIFAGRVTLEDEVNRINVSVTNPVSYVDYHRVGDRPVGDDGPPGDGGPPENGSVDDSDVEFQVGYDVLKLDGDGLPDYYEEDVVGTDPLGPDSDSRFTDADESEQGMLDGAKDFSGDRLTTYQEYRIGSDPLVNDTTGDGLGDGFQVLRAGTDPTANDSDGDGTPDAKEDLSGDGLTLLEEQQHGVHPLVNDTDGDGLRDYAEIHEYDSDPVNPDTDSDGLADGEEIRLGQNSTTPDTDGDGVVDGNETFTTSKVDNSSGVEVTATGEGVAVNDIHVRHVTPPNEAEVNRTAVDGAETDEQFAIGPTVRLQGDDDIDYRNPRVTIPIDDDVDLSNTDVRIYVWAPSFNDKWVPLETKINEEARTATAPIIGFGYYAVFDADAWENVTSATATPGWPVLEQFEDKEGWRGDGRVENDKLVVSSGGANFEVTEFEAPDEAWEGDTITIEAIIENTGSQADTQTVAYEIAGTEEKFERVHLEPGEQTTVRFFYTFRQHSDVPVRDLQTTEHAVVTDDDRWNATITVHWNDDGDGDEPEGPAFKVSGFEGPGSAQAGEEIDVEATVTNTGDEGGETTVVYHFGTDAVSSKTVDLEPGEETTVVFTYLIPALTPTRYYHHNISANDGEDAAGAVIHVQGRGITPDRPGIFTVCLAGQAGGECSGITGLSRSPVTGHYGAAPSGMATDRTPAVGNDDPAGSLTTASNESMAVRALSLPDADSIPVQVRVRATTEVEGDTAEILLETDSKTYTLFSQADGQSTDEWVTVETDVWALGGKDARLIVRTEGNATVEVDYVSIMADSTNDGVPDTVEEMDLGMPVGLQGVRGTPLDLDPTKSDTTGDGVTDHRQVDIEWDIVKEDGTWQVWASADEAVAHPAMNDTDRDGVADVDEVNGWTVNVVNKTDGSYVDENPYRWDSGQALGPNETRGEVEFDANPLLVDTDGDGIYDGKEKEVLHTDPQDNQTYGITVRHQVEIVDELIRQYNGEGADHQPIFLNPANAITLLRVGGFESLADLENLQLTDATDDFGFVTNEKGGLVYLGMDYTYRTDTWLTNEEVLNHRNANGGDLRPWDPDSDDDGLTDGQETHGMLAFQPTENPSLWRKNGHPDAPSGVEVDGGLLKEAEATDELDPVDPDSDDDGWWDGWMGVYDAGYNSENVILYMDNLRTVKEVHGIVPEFGLKEHQIGQEQVGVHKVRNKRNNTTVAPAPFGVDLTNDNWTYHSNLHVGELHWGTNPDSDWIRPNPSLQIEVDYLAGRDPSVIKNSNGVPVLEAVERNLRLHGFDVSIEVDDRIEIGELENTCKSNDIIWDWFPLTAHLDSGLHTMDTGCQERIDHDSFNRWELGIVEDKYHDNPEALHLFWGTRLEHQSPGTPVDNELEDDLNGATGVAMNNGAQRSDWGGVIENEFGVMISVDEIGGYNPAVLQSTTMHEIGHALGIGWADDTPIKLIKVGVVPKGMEVYSGDVDGSEFEPDITPEVIDSGGRRPDPRWSIMKSGTADDTRDFTTTTAQHRVFAFSIEELSTIDFEQVPSREE